MSDLVDRVRRQWQDVHPDLDTSGMAVVGRVLRLASLIRRATDDLLLAHDLNRPEFDVLCALRRNEVLNPGQISREMLSSGAAITKRLDRLERLGLVSRTASERDRRVVQVRLTERGVELIDELLPEHLDGEKVALANLSSAEQDELAGLLKVMLETLEGVA
ncbi:MarR family winged helix-turn-helix transcriptional regulator [Amycolatopsis thermophila]|uniref:DNA-binding MarR family transcriptional regulator n=1 Tax=Amycolatopsis thermophila TaxID=206084 RepID=A0ABU0ERW3_9PSEU|nr:MarR family transcriptional regulator [Amycolatopsis thermophila]MDQ0378033.1 DNA-binding MarR family transcriptional regulator [Amycolatopsis thermophila]